MGKLQDIKVRAPKEYYEKRKSIVDLDKYVIPTERSAEEIDDHIRVLRDNDRC